MELALATTLAFIIILGISCILLFNKVTRLIQEKANLTGRLESLKANIELMGQEGKTRENLKHEMKNEFQLLASRIFEDRSKKFTEVNQSVLTPLREQMGEFRRSLETSREKDIAAHASLLTKIQELQSLNEQLSGDAKQLTFALKGDPRSRGAWGEMILEKVLEASGLQAGREYELQPTYHRNGQALRPDAIIHLPRKRHVIVDSKLSLVYYEAALSATTKEEREKKLKAHAASIRKHVSELGGKYQDLEGLHTLDATLMFIPIESAFAEGLRIEPHLQEEAFGRGIVLAGPSTLFAHLKSIHMAWGTENRERNIESVMKEVKAFIEKIANFSEDLEKVGKHLNQAEDSYHEAHKKLISGKGSVVSRVKKIQKLGSFHATKGLPDTNEDE